MDEQAYKQSIYSHIQTISANYENKSYRPAPDTSQIMPARTRFQTRVEAKKARTAFLRFPPELRLMIYEHLFRGARVSECASEHRLTVRRTYLLGLYGYRDFFEYPFTQPEEGLLSMLQTCKTIRAEALQILARHLTLEIRGFRVHRNLPMTIMLLRQIRILEWNISRPFNPVLTNMPELQQLTILTSHHPHICFSKQMFQNWARKHWKHYLSYRDIIPREHVETVLRFVQYTSRKVTVLVQMEYRVRTSEGLVLTVRIFFGCCLWWGANRL